MNRKYIILIGTVVLLMIVVVVFWVTRPKKTNQTTELNWVTYNEEEKNFADIIAAYEKKNNVKINFIKKDLQNYEVESLNSLSTGKIDIWGIPNNWLPKHQDKLANLPSQNSSAAQKDLEDYKSLYPKIIVQENIINDKIYGFPISIDPLVLYANDKAKSDAIADRELPRDQQDLIYKTVNNWDDITAQAQILTKKQNGQIAISGLALGTSQLDASSDILTLLMLQNGTQMTSENNSEATFHTSVNKFGASDYPSARALDFYTSFAKNTAEQTFSDDFTDPLRSFAQNKIVYYFDFLSLEAELKRINPEIRHNIVALPQIKETKNPVNLIRYETFTVPKSSKNQAVAWDFLNNLISDQNPTKYYQTSKNPPALLSELGGQPESVFNAIDTATTWYNPDAIKTDEIFRSAIDQVLAGKNSQTVLDGAAQKVTDLLKKLKE